MARTASLALFLFVFWLLLSGHYTAWLVCTGLVVSIVLAIVARRLGFADDEGHPIDRLLAGLAYWPWLAREIFLSSLAVARIVLDPKLPIAPALVDVPLPLKTPTGVATYGNSITLTPGTITVEVDRAHDRLRVHALTAAGAADLLKGEMAARVARFEGGR